MSSPIEMNGATVASFRRRRLRRILVPALRRVLEAHVLFPLFSLLLLIVGWTAVVHLIDVERGAAIRATAELSRELADTYEAQMVRNLAAIDQTLKTVKYAYELKGAPALRELQDKGLLPSPIVFEVAVASENGALMVASRPQYRGSIAGSRVFRNEREREAEDAEATPMVSRVERNDVTGQVEITFSRRLRGARGGFGGIVMVSVDPAYFTSGYDTARMGTTGLLALLGSDGIVRARQVGEEISWGESLSAETMRTALVATSDQAQVREWDDGVQRYTNVHVLHGFPLLAVVGLGADEQCAQFRHHRATYLIEAVIASMLLMSLAFILSRTSWQLSVSRKRARQAEQTFYAASENSLDAFFFLHSEKDAHGRIDDFVLRETNRRGIELSGLAREHLLGRTLDVAFPGFRQNGMFEALIGVVETGVVEEHEWLHARGDASFVWLHRQVVRVEDGVVAIVRDISARKGAESRRIEQNRVLEMIATSTPLKDVLGHLMLLVEAQIPNARCAALLPDEDGEHLAVWAAPGLPDRYAKRVHGAPIGAHAGPGGRAIYSRRPVIAVDLAQDPDTVDHITVSGLHGIAGCWGYPVLSPEGVALGALTFYLRVAHAPDADELQVIAMATRIAGIAIERSQAEARIHHMATHDALTGLPNRALLADRLDQVLLQAQRYERGVTVVFIDLDNFKLINDSLGHHAGDDLLKQLASRMVNCLRRTDTVVRLGGDEFVIVLFNQEQGDENILPSIEKIREALLDPVDLAGQTYRVTCSMGLATYPADGADAETLLMNADAAMYRAKELGRNNYQFYTRNMNERIHEKLDLQSALRQAIANDEFTLLYQPQVDLKSERIFGVEALLRWEHPEKGTIMPGDFIPIAEETGLIVAIDEWVLRAACAQNKAWQDAGMPMLTMSVNVSGKQFLQSDWSTRVSNVLRETGLAACYLELEVSEAAIMQDIGAAIATMRALQAEGIRLAIDDFGAGYSSLTALAHYPVVRLKLDQAFVQALPGSADDSAIAREVIRLGQQFDLSVIAEGVENAAQSQFLRENDCHEMQGYHYSRPMPAAALEVLLREPFRWSAT
ncbi:EAL domain-containing protein [Robbsia sp. Bb-Pol-6]|uniref:EAL domain-containing protein n=1 Tax=Robbsia betulipollinis TaxID=2981849 RepID=A0ABT3ZSF3_9BURK|nr:EAL domain-containing protein [Robbsia betulipollinis]MCY0389473.1 EAL domain-containing protein [Robbsia betulipollinis]